MAGKLIESLQTDLSTRLFRVTNGFNESLYLVANEPSLGMYRLQEHVHATVPKVVEQKLALQQINQQISGACYDLGYDTLTVQSMSKISHFPSISAKILKAVELKSQLDTTENRKETPAVSTQTTSSPVVSHTSINSVPVTDLQPKVFD